VSAVTWTCNGEPLMVRLLERRTAENAADSNGAVSAVGA